MAVTLKFQSSGMMPGDARPVPMRGGSLTVGRGPANDLVLPDPDKMLSKSHFVIEDHNGNVVIVDLSTNGTFLNYSKIPLGRTPTPLNDGDVLSVGGYEMLIEIAGEDEADFLPGPAEQAGVSHGSAEDAPDPMKLLDDSGPEGDFLDDLLGSEGGPKGPGQIATEDPMDALLPPLGDDDSDPLAPPAPEESGADSRLLHGGSMQDSYHTPQSPSGGGANLIPDDWDPFAEEAEDDLSAPPPQPPAPPMPPAPAAPIPEETQAPPPATPAAPAAPATPAEPPAAPPEAPSEASTEQAAPPAGGDAARAFLKALEAEELTVPDAELESTMARMGRVMRSMITGLREVLMTRTSIKSEFRIDQTMISAGGNNPLKFSISPEQAIESMVRPRARGYLAPEEAAEEALRDIKAHEVAMVTGMEAALKGVLSRLDPAELTAKIESAGKGGLFKGKKARYWEIYEQMYAEISDQAENDFHDLFSREFARAYKEQLEKLK